MIKNFYNMPPTLQANCHDGEGTIRITDIFKGENIATGIQFLHYTVLPPGTSIGYHQHGNNEEFYIILAGTGEMEMDGTTTPVGPGAVVKNKPYGSHGLKNTAPDTDLEILVFEITLG